MTKGNYTPIYAESEKVQLKGEFTGNMILYDWAGNSIEEQYRIAISNTNQQLKLIIGDEEFTPEYTAEGNGYIFNKLHFNRPNPMGGRSNWEINQIYFRQERIGNTLYLIGDASLYSSELKEPGPHAYIIVKTTISDLPKQSSEEDAILTTTNKGKEVVSENTQNNEYIKITQSTPKLKAYPNPFDQKIQIEIELPKSSKLNLYIMNSTGQIVKTVKNKYQTGIFRQR